MSERDVDIIEQSEASERITLDGTTLLVHHARQPDLDQQELANALYTF